MKKLIKRLIYMIETAYQACGVRVKAQLHTISRTTQHFVFRLVPERGAKSTIIFNRATDVQQSLQAPVFVPFREGIAIYLVVSFNSTKENRLLPILNSPAFCNNQAQLPVALGYDLMGRMAIEDLAQMPHAMYVGATRSGKSMGLICLILSLICKDPVSKVSLVIVDIGGRTLGVLQNVPHLSYPVIMDTDTGIYAVKVLADEMERRYTLDDFELEASPAIICVMDEYVSFIGNIAKEKQSAVENNLTNILRRGRKVKIHMVLATQNPNNSAMKAEMSNITSRMVFRVARYQDSIAGLNHSGAEKLPGNGAMLHISTEYPVPIHIQGAYISPEETEQLVARVIAANQCYDKKFIIPEYAPTETAPTPSILPEDAQEDREKQQELAEIIFWTLGRNDASVDQIKRKFSMGNRAKEIMDKLYELALVSEKFANQPRQVLPQTIEEVPDSVLKFLEGCGFSAEVVKTVIDNRLCGKLAIPEEKA